MSEATPQMQGGSIRSKKTNYQIFNLVICANVFLLIALLSGVAVLGSLENLIGYLKGQRLFLGEQPKLVSNAPNEGNDFLEIDVLNASPNHISIIGANTSCAFSVAP